MQFPYKAILVKMLGDIDASFEGIYLHAYTDNNGETYTPLFIGDVLNIHDHVSFAQTGIEEAGIRTAYNNLLEKNEPLAVFSLDNVTLMSYAPLAMFESFQVKHKCRCPDINFYYNGIGCQCKGD